jgi:hypothetical protein
MNEDMGDMKFTTAGDMMAVGEVERMRRLLQDIVEGWDWWSSDPYNRCQSIPSDAIEEARKLLKERE